MKSLPQSIRNGSVRFLTGTALAFLILTAVAGAAPAAEPVKGKPIDVVICLDTSNSMDGLIAAAKLKLWDIVNDLAKVKPTPDLRVGLYSYGNDSYDPRTGWVRKENDLTSDLDAIYQRLNGLTTNGGTEYAALRVSRDAIEQQKWSEDKDVLKIIFVCGNEPANQDRMVTLQAVADKAIGKGIVINPIYCGRANEPAGKSWKDFATMSGGKFVSIDQDRGTVVIETPQDKQLADLSARLNATYVPYGRSAKDRADNQLRQDYNAYNNSQAAAATRAVSKATDLYRNAEWDLVDRLKEDPKFDIKKVPQDELCEKLQKMTPDERVAHVKKMAEQRADLQKQISELSTKRQEYIGQQNRKNPSQADRAFDAAIRGSLREQAAKKGIVIPE